ncbi:MAG: ABC transporter ATP-binding protein [bacterium]
MKPKADQPMLLRVSGLGKSFGGLMALRDFHLSVPQGEICGIMGPNGSGKTVFFDLVSGFITPDTGRIFFGEANRDITRLPSHARTTQGIARTFQHQRLFSSLTTEENVIAGLGSRSAWENLKEILLPPNARALRAVRRSKAERIMRRFPDRLMPRRHESCLALSYANRRRLEIARALVGHPRLVLLDEPTAGMNPRDTYELQTLIHHMKSEGVTFVIIEHKLFFFEDLADRIVVLDQGTKIAEGRIQDIRRNADVSAAYLGVTNASDS